MWYLWLFVPQAIVIVTGNVTVLVAFTRTPALRKRKHFLLVSLAVADLFVGVISVPMYVTISNTSTIYTIQDILFANASVFGLTAVAIERAYAVYFPFKHRTLWKGVYVIGIAVIWIVAAFIALAYLYFRGLFTFNIVIMTAPIISCLIVIIISYSLIWIKMNCMTSVQGHAIHGRDNKLTVTLMIVTVFSLIAWIPFQAILVYAKLCHYRCIIGQLVLVGTTKFLHYSNSMINPIIYALRMPQFKKAVFNAVQCCKQHQIAVQVSNVRPGPNRANVIPLTTNYDNNASNYCQGHAVRDETQLNKNTSIGNRDENQMKDTHL